MSRQIKFRIWDVVSNKFIYDIDGLFKNISVIPSKIFSGEDKLLIAQQWTGFLDKNGHEVYQGDIIKTSCPSIARLLEVKWWTESDGFDWTGWNFGEADRDEVVGNIFENPELVAN